MGGRARICLIEDHAATRAALTSTLSDFPDHVEFVAAFADAESFLASPVRSSVDVALVDLGLPGMSGSDLIRRLTSESSSLRSLALTIYNDEDSVFDALAAGAHGFMLKDEPVEVVLRAIGDAAAGRRPLSSSITRFLIDETLRFAPRVMLTEREAEVAQALANGSSYSECSEKLGIGVGTVQGYVKRIYRKLDVSSKRELALCLERGLPQSAR